MKILILIIITTWSFAHPYPKPRAQIVSSAEQAALIVYENEKRNTVIEPDRFAYRLYEIDFENNKITDVFIPKIKFDEAHHE